MMNEHTTNGTLHTANLVTRTPHSACLSQSEQNLPLRFTSQNNMKMMRTMTSVQPPLTVCSLILLSFPTLCAGELDDMSVMAMHWPAAAVGFGLGNNTGTGNHTDPKHGDESHANEMAANILGYTLVGIIVLMFFFTVVTFGRSCCIGCKNCCVVFSRHGCKGCCRYMRGRRPEGGDAAAGILNEVIFDQEQDPEDDGESGLGRGLLADS